MEVRRPPRRATFGKVMASLIEQESGGRPGIVGPPTKWGRAQGLTQLLPATAKEMASKAGLPWRPDLLRSQSAQGAEYQRRLGETYLREGLERTGSMKGALHYYHGGPNREMWGPKTRAYADAVLSRAGRY